MVGGSAVITHPANNTVQINQTSNRAIVNWQSYNVAHGELVHYQQPGASSIILNRINPQNGASKIYGSITANGQVWLMNPAGIYFGPSAYVNVAGLLATTAGISNQDFLAGRFHFTQSPEFNGAIINEGTIIVAQAGLLALVGNGVVNNGYIEANLGTVILAAGNEFTINFSGNDMIGFTVAGEITKPAVDQKGKELRDVVANAGKIVANGGKILIHAHTAGEVLDHAISLKGVVEARSVGVKNGEIILGGGEHGLVEVEGKLYATGTKASEKGGNVKITGEKILVKNSVIDVRGNIGGGEVSIGGSYQGKGPLPNSKAVVIDPNTKIYADAINKGNGGKVIIWSNEMTKFYGNIYARGGNNGGDGGFVETSGKDYLEAFGGVDASAALGKSGVWLLDPRNVTIQNASSTGGTFNALSPNVFTPTADNAVADRNTIQTSLNGGTSVTITTGATGTQNGDITVADTITKTAGGAATLLLTAASTGTITINQIISSTVGALTVTLNGANAININAGITTLGGNFSSTSLAGTTISAPISTGAGTITVNANTGGTGANNFSLASGGSLTTTNATASAVAVNVNAAGGGTGGATLGGNITTGSGGRITIATNIGGNTTGGSITQSAGTLSVVGAGSFVFSTPTASASSIGTSGTSIATTSAGGTLTLTTGSGGAFVTNTGNLTLATPTLNTNSSLKIISTAALTLPAAAISTGTGNMEFRSQSGALTTAGALTATSGTLTLAGSSGLTLSNALTTGSGDLSLSTTAAGTLTQNAGGTINSTSGNLTISALDAVTLAGVINTGSGTVAINTNNDGAGASAFTMNAGGSIATTNTTSGATAINVNAAAGGTGTAALRSITVGNGGTITVKTDTGGNITGGDITQTAATLLDAGATGTVTLTNPQIANNNIGTVAANVLISAGNLNLTTGTSGAFVTNSGIGALNLGTISDTGVFTLTSTSSTGITDSGTLAITGVTTLVAGATQDITLDSAANDFSTIAVTSGNNVTLNDTNALIFGASTISGNLSLTTNGAVTQSAAITVAGTATFAAGSGNNITLNTATNNFNTAKFTSGNNVSITDTNAIDLGASTVSGTLGVTSTGAITQSGNLSVTGTTTLAAGATNNITLNNSGNDFSTVVLTSGNNVLLRDTNALVLGAFTVSGTFGVTTNGALTQSGTLTITGVMTLASGAANDITLSTAANNFSTVGVTSGNNVTLRDTNAIIMGASTIATSLNLTAGGAITQSGSITVPSLTAKTLLTAGAAITLTDAGNDITTLDLRARNTADTANGPGALSYQDANGFDVAVANTTSTVTLTGGGAMTQSGSMAGTTLTAKTLNNTGAAINFNNAANAFTTIDLRARNVADTANTAGAITYQDSNAIAIAEIDTASTLSLTANTTISQTGALTVSGTPTFTASAASTDILLASAANDFATTPVFATSGTGTIRDISLRNINAGAVVPSLPSGLRNLLLTFDNAAMVLPAMTLTGTLGATSNGAMTQSGALVIAGVATLASGAANNITLNNAANNFATVGVATGNNVILRDTNAVILGSSTITGTLDLTAGGAITQSGALSVTGATTMATSPVSNITLNTAGNNFSTIGASAVNNLAITDANAVDLSASTVSGTLAVTSSGNITQSGALSVTGASTFAAGAANNITLSTLANAFTTTVAFTTGNVVALVNSLATVLGTSVVSGTLNVTSGGSVTQSGATILTVTGTPTFTLTSANTDILLGNANVFTTTPVFATSGAGTIRDITLRNTAATAVVPTLSAGLRNVSLTFNNNSMVLPALTLTGTLGATANGAITQSGALNITGVTTVSSGAANNITLNSFTNNFSTFSVTTGNNVNVLDADAIILGVSTISGTYDVTAGGSITQSGILTVTGTPTFTLTAPNTDILIGTNANVFSVTPVITNNGNVRDLSYRNTTASTAVPIMPSGLRNVTLTLSNGMVLSALTASGTLTVSSAGAITQSGALNITGTTTLNAGAANNITLNSFTNNFSTLAVTTGNNVNVLDTNAIALGASTVSGTYDVTAGGTISQSAILTVTGTPTFTLTAANSDLLLSTSANVFSTTPVITNNGNVRDLSLRNTSATAVVPVMPSGLRNVTLTFNGNGMVLPALTLSGTLTTTAVGAITQSGALTVAGTSSYTAGANAITLTNASNALTGAISLSNSGANAISITNSIATALAASAIGQNLTINSTGAITQTGALTIPGTASFTAGAAPITLTTAANSITGAITLSNSGSNNARLTNNRATVLAASSVGQNLTIVAVGAITQTGALTVPGTSSFTAGANAITLTNASNALTGAIALSNSGANAISVINSIATVLAASTIGQNLTINSTGAITQTGALTIPGTASFTAGAAPITLTTATNSMTGAITLSNSGSNNVSLTNNRATALATSSVGQNLAIIAVGAITQTGALTVPGTSSFTAGANAITLTNGSNALTGAITLSNSGANAISVTNSVATALAASTIGQNLTINSTGAITQTGALTIPGTASFSAGTNAITLTSATNNFTGNVSLSNSGANDVSLTTSHALGLAASTIGRNLTIDNTAGAVTVAGNITSGSGAILINAGAQTITLNTGTAITAATTGNSLVLAGGLFINNSNAVALNPGSGNFLVWSGNPANDNRGGIAYNFKQYNATYNVTTVLGTGNGFLYTIAPVVSTNLTGSVSKVYDGNPVATLAPANYGANSGAIDGDTVTLNTPTTGTYNNKNVGVGKAITSISGLAITSATNGAATVYGYQVSSTPGSANVGIITPASLTVSSNAGQTKVYGTNDPAAASTAYSITSGTLYLTDTVTGSMGRVVGEVVGNYNLTQNTVAVSDGNGGNNYSLTFNGSTNPFAITKANLTGSIANQTKTYGVNDPALAGISVTLGGVVNTSVSDINGNVTVINNTGQVATTLASLNRVAGETVVGGPYSINAATFNSLTGSAAGNYNAPTFTGTPTLTIQAANLTGSVANQVKTYGQNDPALLGIGVTLGGVVNTSVTDWMSNVTAINDTGNVAASLASLTRVVGETVTAGPYNITTGTFNSLTGTAAGNYSAPIFSGTPTLTIQTASLTGSIANQVKTYGQNDPALLGIGVTLGGVVNTSVTNWMSNVTAINDTGNVSASLASLTRVAGETVTGGPYNITTGTFNSLTGSAAGNYSAPVFTGTPTLTIQTASLTGSIANQVKTYGQNDPALLGIGVTLGGVVNTSVTNWMGNITSINDTSSVATTLASLSRTTGETVVGGPYNVTAGAFNSLTGSAASNYSAPVFTGTPTLTIQPANLSGSFANQTKVYGQSDPASSGIGVTLGGVINNPAIVTWNGAASVNDVGNVGTTLASYARVAGETVLGSPYAITAATFGALTGSAATNYNAPTYSGGVTLGITPATLIPSLIGTVSKVYDATTAAVLSTANYLLTGVVGSDDVVIVTTNGLYGTKDAGSGKLVSVSSLTLGGIAASNYQLATTIASGFVGIISPAILTTLGITANNKTYNGNTAATLNFNAAVLNGVYLGDTVNFNTASYVANFISPNPATNIPVIVSGLGVTGSSANNYVLTQPTGLTATITGASPPTPPIPNPAVIPPQVIFGNYLSSTQTILDLMPVENVDETKWLSNTPDDHDCISFNPMIDICSIW